ncbi:galactoside alpha-(1,2)-fucosyltransferase 2-like [Carcharodon carcharias]|uniref:galactoside alpha-(1,2)-fucosyltransferase 2-like n=1 Tax=Carcharodon carcharias TaxID=13397 RepID=UPI001B7E285D|nr:galactoside alpha-(1,2)-fucosyltransferase 2-like [Carcharodon carcharias]
MVPLRKVFAFQSKRKKLASSMLFCTIILATITYNYELRYGVIIAKYCEFFENVTMTMQCEIEKDFKRKSASLKGIWTINPNRRLGNQMGESTTLYTLAKLNGHQAYILPAMANYLSPIFKITLLTLRGRLRYRINWKQYNLHDWMDDEYRNIPRKCVMFSGYPCSWTFYHHIREEILREFTFHDFLKEQANAFLRCIAGKRKNVTYVCVHVRRGDYIHVMANQWKGVIADKKYLNTAMAYFRSKYKDVIFAVTSNGMDWYKKNIDNSKGDVFFSDDPKQSSPADDIAILAHCNHTIMTIRTFGYWAAYLAGGETIYLTNFTLPESPFLKLFKYEAAFLPQWTGIPADLSPLLPKKTSN